MARLFPYEIWRAHWRGLTNRTAGPRGADEPVRPYKPAAAMRFVDLVLPWACGIAVYIALHRKYDDATAPSLDAGVAGAVIAGAALLLAGLLTTFSQLVQWRDRYTLRANDRDAEARDAYQSLDWQVRCLIDEAVAHTLWAVVECILLVVVTLGALFVEDQPVLVLMASMVLLGLHILIMTLTVVTRLYAAYEQAQDIDPAISGYGSFD